MRWEFLGDQHSNQQRLTLALECYARANAAEEVVDTINLMFAKIRVSFATADSYLKSSDKSKVRAAQRCYREINEALKLVEGATSQVKCPTIISSTDLSADFRSIAIRISVARTFYNGL